MSVLENVTTESEEKKTYAQKVYLGAKANFPINVQKKFRILKGNSARQLYLTKTTGCRSFDGKIGKTVESGYKEEKNCDECEYKYGALNEKGEKIQCKSQYVLTLEHEDPDTEYILTVSYGAQKNLDAYDAKLAVLGLDADQVITGITRVENISTPGTTYLFEKVGDLELKMTPEERAALENMKGKALIGGPIPVKFAAELLQNLASLDGIGVDRANRLAESIADGDMITGKTN